MSDRPKLVFGLGPQSFEEAWHRLPSDNHPLASSDEQIEHLSNLKKALAESLTTGLGLRLGERMAPLTLADMELLERWSFKRSRSGVVEIQWGALQNAESVWTEVYDPGDNQYKYWKIARMVPNIDPNVGVILIAIETSDLPMPRLGTREFNVGLVHHHEVMDLLNNLNVDNARF